MVSSRLVSATLLKTQHLGLVERCPHFWLAMRAPVDLALDQGRRPELAVQDARAASPARQPRAAVDPMRALRSKVACGRAHRSVLVGVQQPRGEAEQPIEVDLADRRGRGDTGEKA